MDQFHLASPASVIAFTFVVAFVLTCFVFGVYQANVENPKAALRRSFYAMAGACAWMILISTIVDSGALNESPMPGIPLLFFFMIACAVALAFSRPGKWLSALPVWALIGFQAFRLPLELILHEWAKQGTVPTTMTWTGSNFDIITGITALVFAPLSTRSVRAAQIFNALGFMLLLNVMRVAMMSSPLPFAWGTQPPLQLLMHLPYAWIGSVCVTGALAGHLILFRKLRTP
jgi:hypothetical protein